MKIDKKLIKELVNCLDEFNITEIDYQDGDKRIKVSKAQKASSEKSLTSSALPILFNHSEVILILGP